MRKSEASTNAAEAKTISVKEKAPAEAIVIEEPMMEAAGARESSLASWHPASLPNASAYKGGTKIGTGGIRVCGGAVMTEKVTDGMSDAVTRAAGSSVVAAAVASMPATRTSVTTGAAMPSRAARPARPRR